MGVLIKNILFIFNVCVCLLAIMMNSIKKYKFIIINYYLYFLKIFIILKYNILVVVKSKLFMEKYRFYIVFTVKSSNLFLNIFDNKLEKSYYFTSYGSSSLKSIKRINARVFIKYLGSIDIFNSLLFKNSKIPGVFWYLVLLGSIKNIRKFKLLAELLGIFNLLNLRIKAFLSLNSLPYNGCRLRKKKRKKKRVNFFVYESYPIFKKWVNASQTKGALVSQSFRFF